MTAHLSLPAHLSVRGLKDLATERLANRAILFAARLLGVAAGTHLGEFRGRDGGYQDLKARLDRAELLTSIAWRVVSLLHARLRKVPDRHRHHYSLAARFEFLQIRNLLGWNQSRIADQFLVADNTIGNWERERSPESRTVGSLAKPVPPVTRMNDVTRHLVQMMDVTEFKTLFGANTPYLACVFDAFSRLPLAGMTFEARPGGASMARLLKNAVARFGGPKYLITDLGGEFIARVFKKTVARLGVAPRFASADSVRATARLERLWKTLKEISRAADTTTQSQRSREPAFVRPGVLCISSASYRAWKPNADDGVPWRAGTRLPPTTPRSKRRTFWSRSVSDRVPESGPGRLPGPRASRGVVVKSSV